MPSVAVPPRDDRGVGAAAQGDGCRCDVQGEDVAVAVGAAVMVVPYRVLPLSVKPAWGYQPLLPLNEASTVALPPLKGTLKTVPSPAPPFNDSCRLHRSCRTGCCR